jgi:hypothetical protein
MRHTSVASTDGMSVLSEVSGGVVVCRSVYAKQTRLGWRARLKGFPLPVDSELVAREAIKLLEKYCGSYRPHLLHKHRGLRDTILFKLWGDRS